MLSFHTALLEGLEGRRTVVDLKLSHRWQSINFEELIIVVVKDYKRDLTFSQEGLS
jgi:hypothetical protein